MAPLCISARVLFSYMFASLYPDISPVSRNMVPDRYKWTQGWIEGHSRSYVLREDQVQLHMDQPGLG